MLSAMHLPSIETKNSKTGIAKRLQAVIGKSHANATGNVTLSMPSRCDRKDRLRFADGHPRCTNLASGKSSRARLGRAGSSFVALTHREDEPRPRPSSPRLRLYIAVYDRRALSPVAGVKGPLCARPATITRRAIDAALLAPPDRRSFFLCSRGRQQVNRGTAPP